LTPEDATGMFLLLGAGFAIAAFVLLIETIAWIIKKINRKFILEKNADQGSAILQKPDDMRHKSKSNEQCETLVHEYRDQPGFRKRHAYSAGARFNTYEDLNQKSDDRLQHFIPLQTMASLPVTSSPRLKISRMQTPKPNYTFKVDGDEIPEDISYDEYRKHEEDNSRDPTFQTENMGDQYFGAEVQVQSHHTFENVDTTGFLGFMENQDPTEQETDMTYDER
jgi:hypothetical protein